MKVEFDVEITMIQRHINVQKHDFERDMTNEFDGIAAIKAFKELGSWDHEAKRGKCYR